MFLIRLDTWEFPKIGGTPKSSILFLDFPLTIKLLGYLRWWTPPYCIPSNGGEIPTTTHSCTGTRRTSLRSRRLVPGKSAAWNLRFPTRKICWGNCWVIRCQMSPPAAAAARRFLPWKLRWTALWIPRMRQRRTRSGRCLGPVNDDICHWYAHSCTAIPCIQPHTAEFCLITCGITNLLHIHQLIYHQLTHRQPPKTRTHRHSKITTYSDYRYTQTHM